MESSRKDYKKWKEYRRQQNSIDFYISKYKEKQEMGDYAITFTHHKSKSGEEEIYKYNKIEKQYYKCYIQDLFDEERNRYQDKKLQELLVAPTIIGTMLVNLLNSQELIITTLNQCINRIDKLDTNDLQGVIANIIYFSKYITRLLDRYSFVVNHFVDKFLYELVNIIETNKNDIYNQYKYIALNINSNNTFYKKLRNYFNQFNNEDIEKHYIDNFTIKTVSIMFLESIIEDFIETNSYINITRGYWNNKEIKKYYDKLENITIQKMNLPSVEIEMKPRRKASNEMEENDIFPKPIRHIYKITCLKDFLNVSLYHTDKNNRVISICKNCNRFFISDVRNSEKYCKRISPYSKTNKRCCELWQYRFSNTNSNTQSKKLYKNIYDRLHNNEKYKEEWKIFKRDYDKIVEELRSKNYDTETYENELYNWLYNRNEELKRKYPSAKYGKKTINYNKEREGYHRKKKINPLDFEE